jgi:hypothetical protein
MVTTVFKGLKVTSLQQLEGRIIPLEAAATITQDTLERT